jgi:hypothetical protein
VRVEERMDGTDLDGAFYYIRITDTMGNIITVPFMRTTNGGPPRGYNWRASWPPEGRPRLIRGTAWGQWEEGTIINPSELNIRWDPDGNIHIIHLPSNYEEESYWPHDGSAWGSSGGGGGGGGGRRGGGMGCVGCCSGRPTS